MKRRDSISDVLNMIPIPLLSCALVDSEHVLLAGEYILKSPYPQKSVLSSFASLLLVPCAVSISHFRIYSLGW